MLAAAKKKVKAVVAPRSPAQPAFSLPTWAPYAVVALGVGAILLILFTAKGKD